MRPRRQAVGGEGMSGKTDEDGCIAIIGVILVIVLFSACCAAGQWAIREIINGEVIERLEAIEKRLDTLIIQKPK